MFESGVYSPHRQQPKGNLMNIRQIENKLCNIASAVNAIGDSDSKFCMTEVLNLVSEVRHYSQCKASLSADEYPEIESRLMNYLSKFHG